MYTQLHTQSHLCIYLDIWATLAYKPNLVHCLISVGLQLDLKLKMPTFDYRPVLSPFQCLFTFLGPEAIILQISLQLFILLMSLPQVLQ